MGEAGEGRMVTHQQKKMNEKEMVYFSKRFEVPVPEETAHTGSFFKPPEDSPEMKYIRERRDAMGGSLPARKVPKITIQAPPVATFAESLAGSQGREVSTTMAFVRVLTLLLKDHELGKYIVPIIPDEARTFGMESLFRQYGIYASRGQLYKPVDAENFLFYKETRDGQILEEGITEAGSMASFTAVRHSLRQLRRADDSLLHLLFDVRLPAHRRSHLGLRRFSRQGLPDGWHGRTHHSLGRRSAASGWS